MSPAWSCVGTKSLRSLADWMKILVPKNDNPQARNYPSGESLDM